MAKKTKVVEEVVENKTTLELEFKKSAVIAESEYDFLQLTKEDLYFVDLEVTKQDDAFVYVFNVKELTQLSGAKDLNILDKYRVLMNATSLYETAKYFDFDLNPENLYIDYNLNVKVALRDTYSKESLVNEAVFVKKCLCLIGVVLQEKYDYVTFKDSGTDLLNKNKTTALFSDVTSVDEIKEALLKAYILEKEMIATKLQFVNKKKYKHTKILSKIYIFAIVVLCGFLGFYNLYQKPHIETLNRAYEAYVASDYVEVIKEMDSISVSRMDRSAKYMLTMSYIKSDALTEEQKKNILSGITLTTDEKVLDFWVYLAKDDTEESIDIAKQLRNDQYLLYGYMKSKSAIERDDSLSGAQRETQLKDVNAKIKEYSKVDEGNGE